MNISDITPELCEKAKAVKTPEELIALARSEGVELSDEQLEAVSGGAWNDWDDCEKVEYGGTGGCPGVRY